MPRRLQRMPATLRLIVVAVVAGAVAVLVGAAVSGPTAHNPLAGDRFFPDPSSVVVGAEATATPADARVLARIAAEPMARWYGDWLDEREVTGNVREFLTLAEEAGRVPVLVLYDIPHRDCSGASAGGAATAAGYRSFASAFAAGLGSAHSVVIVEPDALAQLDCLSSAQQAQRTDLIRGVVRTLRAHRGVTTYLDAGNSRFVTAKTIASRLRAAGVADTAGFSLNVSNFFTTKEETAYGHAVSKLTGGAHFVIDTSRNGNGPASGTLAWCNPAGRALGHVPTTDTGDDLTDAWLWIKTPGQSDGACRPGEPPAGTFWTAYAVRLANGSS